MKVLILTLETTDPKTQKHVKLAYEAHDDVYVYINGETKIPVSPEWLFKAKGKFFVDAKEQGWSDFEAVTEVEVREEEGLCVLKQW